MYSLRLCVLAGEKEYQLAHLYEKGTIGITERDLPNGEIELEAFFETKIDPRCEPVEEKDWQSQWIPIEVGARFYLVPDWLDSDPPPGRLKLVIHAAQASGSGYHAPTQLALAALEQTLKPADAFLDLGTGSGILTQAAHLLGAIRLYACDIDPIALQEARRNQTPAQLFQGSVRALQSQSIDLIAANLNAAAILTLRSDLLRVIRPNARLILSGFKQRHLPQLRESFPLPHQLLEQDEWRCLILSTE